jgi:hypothetical protein
VESQVWPDVPEDLKWTIEFMEERLERSSRSPRELSTRAEELRQLGAQTEIKGYRDAAVALADRYEEAAATRLASA